MRFAINGSGQKLLCGADLPSFNGLAILAWWQERMFLRAKVRTKNGKRHRYFSVVENRRVGQNRTAQRTVLYLGEINDSQEAIWHRTLQVFDESHQQYTTLSLFPEDRKIPTESSNSIQVKLTRWNYGGRGPSATVGWDASCGGNCGWTNSGKRSWRRWSNEKPCAGRRCCSCWW